MSAGVKSTSEVLRPVQLPARLVDEAIEVVTAVGTCLSKRQQKEFVLEVWGDWQRNMSTSNLLAKSLRTATELGGNQNGLSRAALLVYIMALLVKGAALLASDAAPLVRSAVLLV